MTLRAPVELRIGNDVVDLTHPRCRSRPARDRLPPRILEPGEMAWFLDGSAGPARLRRLWSLWAGKETGFKVVSKLLGSPPTFEHQAFQVSWESWRPLEGSPGSLEMEGRVRWGDLAIALEGVCTPGFIHVVGWGRQGGLAPRPVLESAVQRVPPAGEPDGAEGPARSRSSGLVRELALVRLSRHLSARHPDRFEGKAPRIEIPISPDRPGRTPPRVFVDGEPCSDLDLSLSHHGGYVAWALLLDEAAAG
jgi:hypothetical protein